MLFSQNSQLILRYQNIFKNKKIFFSGNIQDELPRYLSSIKTSLHLNVKNDFYEKKTYYLKKIHIYYNLLVSKKAVENYNTLIYYWPKSKSEAKFQLYNLLSCFSIGTEIFIVGNNSCGVKSATKILKKWIHINKLESAKHSILFAGILKHKTKFILKDFFKTHIWENLYIKCLPGVFGYKKIDLGSQLLASTFSKNIHGEILDIGCGSGFLSVCLLKNSPNSIVTMIDNKESAIISSQETLVSNQLSAKVLSSNLYSNVFNKFNLIISNPPFHNDLKVNFNIIQNIIIMGSKYLKKKGELRFVVNSCFNYDFILKKNFKKFNIIRKTKLYKVYQALL
ncbi:16S rRNA (guanine(1207)-N(2))-methyltransferase RsmC [Buchnera aphidicola]|uniref:Ribosomal RNA small subunit methyltransferase C n=1 Tax=Buchnera aphidicola (Aphis gossypii) TaxID=98785 RepID=A0A5J6ZEW7_9GAMM|nr:16S rRNA (guanine(1207)-N(2))-methyltransferase RsmC [Buchnera aphidicola]QFQ32156.1 16S rRNA (guanine(1207)-N(2))-methyltransferase RsmC [Buchnera aphidicola (Aphis gossypii)]UPT14682.1 16S rRNA (guanine(1207)-N(2))-methyltransferase RsmC [Buchnera aphidicola (Aphis gossypii)]